ncbi:MAG: SDR family oxidoreductase [Myxococcales bacterium]|nr:MAG: SDR family oxidoreductase [Myxococcales bacterium]
MGGTSGIGEATASLLHRAGLEVTIGGRDPDRLAATLRRLPGVRGEQVDGANPEKARHFFAAIGPFDHLVLSLSGGKGAGLLATLSLDDLRSGFEAKLFAHLTSLQAALPYVRSSVTLVGAVSARAALRGTAGLAAINGAVEALVRPLAAELAPVRVNAVSPGVIDTPWWDAMPKDVRQNHFAQAASTLPVGRVGHPDDVAQAIVMLARNGFVTGSVLEVAGGAHLPLS